MFKCLLSHVILLFIDNITADAGGTVTLNCFTTPDTSATWSYQKTTGHDHDDICNVDGVLMNGFRSPRFSLINTDREYHLVIDKLTVTDSGFYSCIDGDGYGEEHVTHLVVLGNELRTCVFRQIVPMYGSSSAAEIHFFGQNIPPMKLAIFGREAQLSQRKRAILRVIEYFAKSFKIAQGHMK